MKNFSLKRTFYALLSTLAGTAFASSAYAAAGDVVTDFAKGLSTPAAGLVYVILYIVREISVYIAMAAAALLNTFFYINVVTVPSGIPVVPIAWAGLRDLTNGAFLLIILWIAFTIILNLDQWGGKRLLFRVIMVALLINFSLLMVTIVFGVANQLGAIFAKNMPDDPGRFIVDAIDLQNVGSVPTKTQISDMSAYDLQREINTGAIISQNTNPIKDTLLASLGVEPVQAQAAAGVGCAGGLLIGTALIPLTGGLSLATGAAFCIGGAVFTGVLNWITGWFSNLFDRLVSASVRMFTQTIFILFTAVTMFLGAITLIIRYGVMIALSVLAPLAFLAAIVPKMQKYFDLWLSTMLRWAFFVPLFYLMMYLGFFIISKVDLAAPHGGGPSGSFDRMLVPFVGLLFMWIALKLARQTGGAIAGAGVGLVAKAGLLAAGGVGALALKGGAAAMARAPEQTQKFAQGLRRIPGIGRKMEAGVMGLGKERKEDIETRMKEVDHYSSEDVAKRYKGAVSSREKAAMAAVLAKRKEMDQHLDENERKEAVKHAERFGVAKDMYKTNPHLIEKDNVDERVKEKRKVLKDADKLGLAPEAYDDDEVILGIITNIKGRKEVKKIAEEAPAVYQRIKDVMKTRQQQLVNIAAVMDRTSGLRHEGAAALRAFDEYELHLANEMQRNERRGRANERRREQEERRERERAAEARVNPEDFIT